MLKTDYYLDRQLDRHYREQELSEEVSNCCGEPVYEDTDICSSCKDHCKVVTREDYEYDREQEAFEERYQF